MALDKRRVEEEYANNKDKRTAAENAKRKKFYLFPQMAVHGVFFQEKTKTLGHFSDFDPDEQAQLIEMDGIYLTPKKRHKYEPAQLKPLSEESLRALGPEAYVVQQKNIKHYYLIMDKLGDSLRKIHDKLHNQFTFKTAAQIGIPFISILEQVHELGYVYNDIKPDNILIGNKPLRSLRKKTQITEEDLSEYSKLKLIDFGLVTRYLDDEGRHIEQGISDKFKGSMLFASKYVFNFTMTSRRDDLISLCYLLVFLVDEDQLGIIQQVEGLKKKEKFKFIKNHKLRMTPQQLCGTDSRNPETYRFTPFVQEVFCLRFDE